MGQTVDRYDVVVLGTGAAGLVAALSAADAGGSVGLFEKSTFVGRRTGLSSGVRWLPANEYARQTGVIDSRSDALAYLDSLSHDMIDPMLAEAFVDAVEELVDWLESRTPLRLRLVPGFHDYHPERPGGLSGGGRSLEPELFSFHELGEWANPVTGRSRPTYVTETPQRWRQRVPRPCGPRPARARPRGGARSCVGGCVAQELPRPWHCPDPRVPCHPLGQGRWARERRRASNAAGSASCGVRRWRSARDRWFRVGLRPVARLPAWSNLLSAERSVGYRRWIADGDTPRRRLGNMREAWWVPVAVIPGSSNYGEQGVQLVLRERTLPRSIMVNSSGHRFANEAANYNALDGALHQLDAATFDYANQPCWLIFDQGWVEEYGGFGTAAGASRPGWVRRAENFAGLAAEIGIPAKNLVETVARWNALVASGTDTDFGRGRSAYDGCSGDQRRYPGPGATLGPLDRGPFYAVELLSSTLGTKGGARTNADGAVLDVDGEFIPGLFAAGNVMAAPTGMIYGGAGGTLGPATFFGYRAGRGAATAPPRLRPIVRSTQ